jgi:hypothetical protein
MREVLPHFQKNYIKPLSGEHPLTRTITFSLVLDAML